MKILFHHRIRSKDGQFVHLSELLHAFQEEGHEVRLVGPKILENAEFGADGGFTDILRARLPKFVFELLELTYSLVAFPRLLWAVMTFRPNFIYERFNLFFPVGAFVSKLTGVPLALEVNGPLLQERTEHGGLALQGLGRWTQEYTWRTACLALPVTQVLADYMLEAGVSPEAILVLHNGVEFKKFADANGQSIREKFGLRDFTVLGFTGFVRPWHGVDSIIVALGNGELPKNCALMVVGEGPAMSNLKSLTIKLHLEERVKFCGLVSRDEIQNYVASFDIALQPAVTPWASPLKVIEYLAAGKAIVGPSQANIRELLQHGENALLFDPNEPLEQIRAVQELCENDAKRVQLGLNGKNTIANLRLTWKENAQRIVSRFSLKSVVGIH